MAKKKYKIHPAIGIARLGDSDEYFVGPEYSEEGWNKPLPPFKKGGKVKPQAARFRVFEYIEKGGKFVVNREINLDTTNIQYLKWEVHVANRKGSFFKFNGLQGLERGVPGRRNGAISASKRKKFEIDPKKRIIFGKSKSVVEIKKKKPAKELWPVTSPQITSLGRLATDLQGNLLFIGAKGVTGQIVGALPISDYANNNGWFDDVADGPISAYLKFKGQPAVQVESAWVISAPPDFAPHISNVVSLYDVLYDLAAREIKIPAKDDLYINGSLKSLKEIQKEFKANGSATLKTYKPSYDKEIYPILKATFDSAFVFGPASQRHTTINQNWKKLADPSTSSKPFREAIFNFIRAPSTPPTQAFPNMPKLLGDEPYPIGGVFHPSVRATVTETQYALLKQWKNGNFIASASPSGQPTAIAGPLQITPHGLDKAALMNCVGAAMYPGIEASWQIRWGSIFKEPFRIKYGAKIKDRAKSPYPSDKPGFVQAGHFTRQMAVPWQADFLECKIESGSGIFSGDWGWWPAQRPDEVFVSTAEFKKSPPNKVEWTRSTAAGVSQNWPAGSTRPSYDEMISNWSKFGFIIEDPANPGFYIETERSINIP